MGGFGSGRNRYYSSVKGLVENCLTLDAAQIDFDRLYGAPTGIIRWKTRRSTVQYRVRFFHDEHSLVLNYAIQTQNDRPVTVQEEIFIEETRPYFGGVRHWFLCPTCGVRVRMLHIPPCDHRLRCRKCHDLTYRSVQTHDKRVDALRRNPENILKILNAFNNWELSLNSPPIWLAMKALLKEQGL